MSLRQRQRAQPSQLRRKARGSIPAAMAHFEDDFCSFWKCLGHRHHECAQHGKFRGERVKPPRATCARSGEQHHQIVAEQQLQALTRCRARARRHCSCVIWNLNPPPSRTVHGLTPSGSVPQNAAYIFSVTSRGHMPHMSPSPREPLADCGGDGGALKLRAEQRQE